MKKKIERENLKPGFMGAIDGLLRTFSRLELVKDAKIETSGLLGGIYWARVEATNGERYDGRIHAINHKWWTSSW